MSEDVIEFLRLVEKAEMRREDISKFLGIGKRTYYRWQDGSVRIPKTGLIAMYWLVGEPLPKGFMPDII